MKNLKEIIHPTAVLTLIILVVSGLLVLTYNATKVEQEGDLSANAISAAQTLFPNSESFPTLDLETLDLDEQITNIVIPDGDDAIGVEITTKGYAKGLVFLVAMDTEGTITGIQIVESSETPGLGTQIEAPEFMDQFTGKNTGPFTDVKSAPQSETEIQVIAGATVSSKAAISSMNLALEMFEPIKEAAGL